VPLPVPRSGLAGPDRGGVAGPVPRPPHRRAHPPARDDPGARPHEHADHSAGAG